jgi:hypothetical protein
MDHFDVEKCIKDDIIEDDHEPSSKKRRIDNEKSKSRTVDNFIPVYSMLL